MNKTEGFFPQYTLDNQPKISRCQGPGIMPKASCSITRTTATSRSLSSGENALLSKAVVFEAAHGGFIPQIIRRYLRRLSIINIQAYASAPRSTGRTFENPNFNICAVLGSLATILANSAMRCK